MDIPEESGFSKSDITSEYNEAKFQILRLHILWLGCNNISKSGNLDGWKWTLDCIWRELSIDALSKGGAEKDGQPSKDNIYYNRVKELNEDITKAQSNANKYDALQTKEIFLRWLQDTVAGKGSKRRASDEEDGFD